MVSWLFCRVEHNIYMSLCVSCINIHSYINFVCLNVFHKPLRHSYMDILPLPRYTPFIYNDIAHLRNHYPISHPLTCFLYLHLRATTSSIILYRMGLIHNISTIFLSVCLEPMCMQICFCAIMQSCLTIILL